MQRKGEVKGQKGEEGAVRKHCHESLSLCSAGCVVPLLNAVTLQSFLQKSLLPISALILECALFSQLLPPPSNHCVYRYSPLPVVTFFTHCSCGYKAEIVKASMHF